MIGHTFWKPRLQLPKLIPSIKILQKDIDTHFPTREIKIHISDKPWISSRTKDLIRRRQD